MSRYILKEASEVNAVLEDCEEMDSYNTPRRRKRVEVFSASDDEEEIGTFRQRFFKRNMGQGAGRSSGATPYSPVVDSSRMENFAAELKKQSELLTDILDRVKKNERRLQIMEDRVKEPESDKSATPVRQRSREIPDEVRRETRRIYSMLTEEDEDFCGWKIEPGITYKDPQNQTVLNRLVREVKALNPTYLSQHIKDAAYRFYRSKNEEHSSKRRGKYSQNVQIKRRHQRLLHKLNERKAMLAKGEFEEGQRDAAQWISILTLEATSSDESCEEDGEEVLLLHPLPWLSEAAGIFKRKLDEQIATSKTPQAKRQMKRRLVGRNSDRNPPQNLPSWALKTL